jgi:hypothetical protein
VLLYLTAGENVPQNEAARSNRLLNVMWPEIWQYIFISLRKCAYSSAKAAWQQQRRMRK